MITKNFKTLLSLILEAYDTKGYLSAKKLDGTEVLLAPYFASDGFPCSTTNTVQITSYNTSAGIYLGSGDAAPTENDHTLASRITSGLTASSPTASGGVDASGNPYKQIIFTLTNTTNADIVVKEIGYAQQMRAGMISAPSVVTNGIFLLDRTVLAAPITIPANNGTAVVKYVLKTIIS